MKTTKQFALVALLVLGATLSASTPARAQFDLTPTGAEPTAAGQATLYLDALTLAHMTGNTPENIYGSYILIT